MTANKEIYWQERCLLAERENEELKMSIKDLMKDLALASKKRNITPATSDYCYLCGKYIYRGEAVKKDEKNNIYHGECFK